MFQRLICLTLIGNYALLGIGSKHVHALERKCYPYQAKGQGSLKQNLNPSVQNAYLKSEKREKREKSGKGGKSEKRGRHLHHECCS